MAEFILFILIFVGIMAVSALIFGGWFLVMIIRGDRPAAAERGGADRPGREPADVPVRIVQGRQRRLGALLPALWSRAGRAASSAGSAGGDLVN